MNLDEECLEVLLIYARDVLNEPKIYCAEYDHEGFEIRITLLNAVITIG